MIATAAKDDFPDWLSPVLVKELRQGLRSRVFAGAFFGSQLLLVASLVFSLTSWSGGRPIGDVFAFLTGLFWVLVGIPLILVMPIRGLTSLDSEIRANTIDLVFLSRLSAWRILFGKWLAIVVQTTLLVCAALPYVVMRYFLGGVDLLKEIESLAILYTASIVLTAAMVAISPNQSKWQRVLIFIGMFFGFQFFFFWFLALMFSPLFGSSAPSTGAAAQWQIYLTLLVLTGLVVVLALEVGASRIAPAAENHALRKRLLVLLSLATAALLAVCGVIHAITAALFSAAVCILFSVDALSEPVPMLRTAYAPLWNRGPLGRFAALFLSPGWPSGLLFTLALAGGWYSLYVLSQINELDLPALAMSLLAAILVPAALIRVFQPTPQHFAAIFITVQLVCVAVGAVGAMIDSFDSGQIRAALSVIPTCMFLFLLAGFRSEQVLSVDEAWLIASAEAAGATLLLAFLARRPLLELRRVMAATAPRPNA
jgi:hypothetical protein